MSQSNFSVKLKSQTNTGSQIEKKLAQTKTHSIPSLNSQWGTKRHTNSRRHKYKRKLIKYDLMQQTHENLHIIDLLDILQFENTYLLCTFLSLPLFLYPWL